MAGFDRDKPLRIFFPQADLDILIAHQKITLGNPRVRMAFPTGRQSFDEEFSFDLPMFAHGAKSVALPTGSRRRAKGDLVTATKLQRAPSRNAAFMRQIWARRRLLPDESGLPVAVARCLRAPRV